MWVSGGGGLRHVKPLVNLMEDVTLQVRKKVGGLLHLGEEGMAKAPHSFIPCFKHTYSSLIFFLRSTARILASYGSAKERGRLRRGAGSVTNVHKVLCW